jgi:predicted hydrolase (HD superfamily)
VSTYVTVDIYEDTWLRCDEHPLFSVLLKEGASSAEIADIVKAHNEHAEKAGCGSVLVFL